VAFSTPRLTDPTEQHRAALAGPAFSYRRGRPRRFLSAFHNRRQNGHVAVRCYSDCCSSKSGCDVCFWHKADITIALNHVRF
jgi:hypothetical protein